MQANKNGGAVNFTDGRAALVVAHPGHELRVYSWVQAARPQIFILTDGSGHAGKPRIDSTTKILEPFGVKAGSIYGRLTDRQIYSAILGREFELFIALVDELAETLLGEEMDYVVGDAMEGYNPAHDVCRLVINAAVKQASHRKGQAIPNFEILLTSKPSDYPEATFADAIWLHLDEELVAQKLECARAYAELTGDVESILKQEGQEAIRTECLRPVSTGMRQHFTGERPYYETYGERQVGAGFYDKVIRYQEHFVPLAQALNQYINHKD